jgi:hypothetical protein
MFAVPALATAQDQPDMRDVSKWSVHYQDMALGEVEGVAYCKWDQPSSAAEPQCRVIVRDPKSAALQTLVTKGPDDVRTSPHGLSVTLHGESGALLPSPSPVQASALPGQHVSGADGSKATIVVKNGDIESKVEAPVRKSALPDDNRVVVELWRTSLGALRGEWRYLSSPLTQRDRAGGGRTGVFNVLKDKAIAAYAAGTGDPGGFMGLQQGGEIWLPKPPQIYGVQVLEDPSDFNFANLRYPLGPSPGLGHEVFNPLTHDPTVESDLRTLVLIGRDFPIDDTGRVLQDIKSGDSGLRYKVLAISTPGKGQLRDLKFVDHQNFDSMEIEGRIGRGFARVTQGMDPAKAADYRKLDAVLVQVKLESKPQPGPQGFTWGTTRAHWDSELQYGDSTADVRFVRLVGSNANDPANAAAPPSNLKQDVEVTGQLALPEKVTVEVETGTELSLDSLPVIVGGPGISGNPIPVDATRAACVGRPSKTRYCTPTLVFLRAWGVDNVAADGAIRIPVQAQGGRVFAAVDRSKTHFLRASLAVAVAGEPSRQWLDMLRQVDSCPGTPWHKPWTGASDWPDFAKLPTGETVHVSAGPATGAVAPGPVPLGVPTSTRGSGSFDIDITYGDHAAMLLLRESFVREMRAQLSELDGMAGDSPAADDLVDAWYRSTQWAVTKVPNFPLAGITVQSPAGPVPFSTAYIVDFQERTFGTSKSEKGEEDYRKWRRQAAREVIAYLHGKMEKSQAAAEKIEPCARRELLKLTGSGFNNVAQRLLPLMMKLRPAGSGDGLAEPDFLARAYIKNLDVLAQAIGAAEAYADLRTTAIIMVAAVAIPPLAGEAVVWTGLGTAAQGQAVTLMVGALSGMALAGYDALYMAMQTYKQHEEVQFALGAMNTLGLERYFEAADLATPWWQTGLKITGELGLAIFGVPSVLPGAPEVFSEGLTLWRGSRVAARLAVANTPAGLQAVRQISDGEKRDLILYLLKEQQLAAQRGVVGEIRDIADRMFGRLGREVENLRPIPDPPAMVKRFEAQALSPRDDFRPASAVQPDPARELKTELTDSALYERARAENAEADAARREEMIATSPGRPAAGAASTIGSASTVGSAPTELPELIKPFPVDGPIPSPKAGQSTVVWSVTTKSGEQLDFEIDNFVGSGVFSQVYSLKKAPAKAPVAHLGDKLVVKVIRKVPGGKDSPAFTSIPELQKNVLARARKARELLKKAGIGQADFVDFEGVTDAKGETYDILVQQKVDFSSDKIFVFPSIRGSEKGELPITRAASSPEQRKAVVQMFDKASGAGIVLLDAHSGNIYLELTNNGWEAKFLDQDFVEEFNNIQDADKIVEIPKEDAAYDAPMVFKPGATAYSKYLANMRRRSIIGSDLRPVEGDGLYLTARSVNQKMLEAKGWLSWDFASDVSKAGLAPWLLVPDEVQQVLRDLPNVVPAAPSSLPTLPPQKGGWLLERFEALPPHRFANDNSAQPRFTSRQVA